MKFWKWFDEFLDKHDREMRFIDKHFLLINGAIILTGLGLIWWKNGLY